MRFKNIINCVITIAALIGFKAKGQNPIILKGSVDTSLMSLYKTNDLYLLLKTTSYEESYQIVAKIPISSNGAFSSVLDLEDSLVHLSIQMKNENTNAPLYGKFFNLSSSNTQRIADTYLFQQGDSINMRIMKDGNFIISGKGSKKLNCQWQMYKTTAYITGIKVRASQLTEMNALDKALSLDFEGLTTILHAKLMILESYKHELPEEIFETLRLDALGTFKQVQLNHLNGLRTRFFNHPGNSKIINDRLASQLKNGREYAIDLGQIIKSPYYTDSFFYKMALQFNTENGATLNISESTLLKLYSHLSVRYKGILRDKLLYICFFSIARRSSVKAKEMVSEVLKDIQNTEMRKSIEVWREKQAAAFAFKLYDSHDKLNQLTDYKGKLLIIDFWFTGCTNCKRLTEAMHPVIEHFKNHKNVSFLTVSTDHKDVWLKSVSSGKYTSPASINLYTKGMGWNHPLIQYYNFINTGFPRQLIISATGELITSTPPRADLGEVKRLELIKIIEQNLP